MIFNKNSGSFAALAAAALAGLSNFGIGYTPSGAKAAGAGTARAKARVAAMYKAPDHSGLASRQVRRQVERKEAKIASHKAWKQSQFSAKTAMNNRKRDRIVAEKKVA